MKKNEHTLHEKNHKAFLAALALLVVLVLVFSSYLVKMKNRQSSITEAEEVATLQSESLASNSSYQDASEVTFFNMTSGSLEAPLYAIKSEKQQDVMGFLASDPQFELDSGQITSLIPETVQNLRFIESIDDRQEAYLLSNDEQVDATHYYYEQMRCGNIPVFASNIQVHAAQNEHVYALSGALIKNDVDCAQNMNESQAESIANTAFQEDVDSETEGLIVESRMYVFNPGLVGDDTQENLNYLTQYVELCNETGICRGYFVDKKSGDVVFSMQTSSDTLNRRVSSGSTTRTEQGGASGNAKLDQTFDILGSTYTYFNTKHQLDSYDGNGSTIVAQVPSCSNNASWNGSYITVCSQLVASDVIAHEFQHAVTQFAVGGQSLIYQNESGALNESLSDIFGYALDNSNWTMGEATSLGVIRDMSNPTRKGHPSRMFGTVAKDGAKYYCESGDGGGVHINSGVFNKAFYLMVEGGAFNDCNITGLGKANVDKAHLVVFRALKTYMKGKNAGNYRDMYDAMVQACNDVHQAGSAECATITAAMQAVEMDQQTSGKSRGPSCTGATAKPATCVGGSQPAPTGSTPPPAGSPTVDPSTVPSDAPVSPPPSQGKKTSPLRSSVSAPQSATGDVELDYDGQVYRLNATLSETAFASFFSSGTRGFANSFQAGVPLRGELVGPEVLDTGTFTYENGKYVNSYSSGKDLSQYGTYQVVAINDKGEEIPFLLGDLGTTQAPDSSGNTPVTTTLNLSIRLQGIEKKPNSTEAVLVRVGVGGESLPETQYKSVLFTPGEGGIWKGKVDFDIPDGAEYKVLVKGPKHTQRKLCENNPKEELPGLYKCTVNTIELKKGENTLDFSNVIMLAGDLPAKQDGIVNSRDVIAVREKLSKSDFEALAIADVNYDGVVNAVDDALVVFTLANRTDQN